MFDICPNCPWFSDEDQFSPSKFQAIKLTFIMLGFHWLPLFELLNNIIMLCSCAYMYICIKSTISLCLMEEQLLFKYILSVMSTARQVTF